MHNLDYSVTPPAQHAKSSPSPANPPSAQDSLRLFSAAASLAAAHRLRLPCLATVAPAPSLLHASVPVAYAPCRETRTLPASRVPGAARRRADRHRPRALGCRPDSLLPRMDQRQACRCRLLPWRPLRDARRPTPDATRSARPCVVARNLHHRPDHHPYLPVSIPATTMRPHRK